MYMRLRSKYTSVAWQKLLKYKSAIRPTKMKRLRVFIRDHTMHEKHDVRNNESAQSGPVFEGKSSSARVHCMHIRSP
jgi:hypothetical protein